MALYAFDGTGNTDKKDNRLDSHVVRLRDAYKEGEAFYIEGVGTRFGILGKAIGGLTGAGGHQRINEMMQNMLEEHEADKVVDIIGFSRGAAMAVHFAHVAKSKGYEVRFLGLFDVVGSFGLPGNDVDIGWLTKTVPDNVHYCAHAMAYNERRHNFKLTRQSCEDEHKTTLVEMWFRGVHSDIGGTTIANEAKIHDKGRTAISLGWMAQQARLSGMLLSEDLFARVNRIADSFAPISTNKDPVRETADKTRLARKGDVFHDTAATNELSVGEIRPIRCYSRVPFNPSGILFKKGQTFKLDVSEAQMWRDGELNCNADGWDGEEQEGFAFWKTWVLEQAENSRRMKGENWFKLIGVVNDVDDDDDTPSNECSAFVIGAGSKAFQANKDGELYTYANDLKQYTLLDKYTNNKGWVDIEVTRIS